MASRMTCRSSLRTASRAARIDATYAGIAMAARMAMISITTINSTRVKPASCRGRVEPAHLRERKQDMLTSLPIGVLRSIERNALRLGGDVEDTLSSPGVAIGVVLHGT